ncbi:protein phosphatase 2C [Metschnikowia bicuspidata var. bicuspidata NRRL YB-4993]|uniref:Protein phosphatase 2C n=1 Tax=Metschnikowia bicuspidata var. bicuspidata NRRL YB-4993 TaxID=869754 RepID=A0A1A0H827_9ASCO|nr:protein phosphatase 2C [Metschnikowia bicuspidata var. bicuspidata NRRL YB-4993]OBA20140.1 protein phosphatase 2C [Metschnikowia bicuspidata var. bicuspidata NRRL YB-4993]
MLEPRKIAHNAGKSTPPVQGIQDPLDPFQGLSFLVGVAENKNSKYRAKMEDVHTYVANFAERLDWGYFAIFDGHAGKLTARWCGNHLHGLLEQEILEKEAGSESSDATPSGLYDMKQLLCDVFVKADEIIDKDGSGSSGSTAAVAILRWETADLSEDDDVPLGNVERRKTESESQFDFVPTKDHRRMLYTSNVGDLRIVLCRGGKLYRLSYDHKASDPNEIQRVRDEGGLIVKNRVNGVLAITRSLGDSYVKNLVTGRPFTTVTEITNEDEFLILACDGVWDVMSDQQACRFVQDFFNSQRIEKQPYDPSLAAKKLCDLAIEKATTDNITVMVVKLDANVFV